MLLVAIGEILVVLLVRPLRWLSGGERTRLGRGLLRFERWLLHHLHVINAESLMRDELDRHGQATSFLAEGVQDQSGLTSSTSETLTRVRKQVGADHQLGQTEGNAAEAGIRVRRPYAGEAKVAPTGGSRSADMQAALQEAQRRQERQQQQARRRPPA